MKKMVSLFISAALIINLAGCSGEAENTQSLKENKQLKAVKVLEVKEDQQPVSLKYIGTVDTKELVKYSFKVPGQIYKIYVSKGKQIKKGDKLAELDTKDLGFQVSAAKAMMDTASLNIKKAEDSLTYTNSLYKKINNLYRGGALPKDQYEQLQLKKEVAESEFSQAKSQFDAAKTDYAYKLDLLKTSVIYAEQDGSVVEKTFNENERVGAYLPVVIVRSGEQIINVGIPQQELDKVSVGSKATVVVDNDQAEGTVTNISEAPDQTTRTYTAEITVSKKTFRLGSIAKVSVNIGMQKGVWIPMSVALSDGESYVYVVKNERAFKRTIETLKVTDDKLLIKGVNPGELLVVSGMKNLEDGAKVKIQA